MYLAYEPTRQMWETPVSPPLMGFGQETTSTPTEPVPALTPEQCSAMYAYPEPQLGMGGQIIAFAISFGIMVVAAYAGARWALSLGKAR